MSFLLYVKGALLGSREWRGIELFLFFAALVISGLDAYALFGVPAEWYAFSLLFVVFCSLCIRRIQFFAPGVALYLLLFFWSLVVVLASLASMQEELSAGEYSFVIRRFFRLAGFIAALICSHWVISVYGMQRFSKIVVFVGCAYSLLGIYVYFSQLSGWPEWPRNRIGTSGGEQSVVFTYPFHRLMGTFREPGLFVGWILLPLFLAFFSLRSNYKDISPGIILGATLLTGSLAAAIVLLFSFCVVFVGWLVSGRQKDRVAPVLLNICLGILIFSMCVRGYSSSHGYHVEDTSSYSALELVAMVVKDRLFPLVAQGAGGSNRAYIFDYLSGTPFSLFGDGLGLAHLKFADYLSVGEIPSFLNMFAYFGFSSGLVGLLILCSALLRPFYKVSFSRLALNSWLVALYLAYILMFFSTVEELSLSFAIVIALMFNVSSCEENKIKPSDSFRVV